MKLYHATSAAQAILADGFRDWSGSYGLADVEGTPLILTGVFISDRPLSAIDGAPLNWGGAPGHGVFEVTIPDDVDFERLISRTACREFSSQHPMARWPDLADDLNTRVGAHARTRPVHQPGRS